MANVVCRSRWLTETNCVVVSA